MATVNNPIAGLAVYHLDNFLWNRSEVLSDVTWYGFLSNLPSVDMLVIIVLWKISYVQTDMILTQTLLPLTQLSNDCVWASRDKFARIC